MTAEAADVECVALGRKKAEILLFIANLNKKKSNKATVNKSLSVLAINMCACTCEY